jgi:hypothetical protein
MRPRAVLLSVLLVFALLPGLAAAGRGDAVDPLARVDDDAVAGSRVGGREAGQECEHEEHREQGCAGTHAPEVFVVR